jgi:hypothetical protein
MFLTTQGLNRTDDKAKLIRGQGVSRALCACGHRDGWTLSRHKIRLSIPEVLKLVNGTRRGVSARRAVHHSG